MVQSLYLSISLSLSLSLLPDVLSEKGGSLPNLEAIAEEDHHKSVMYLRLIKI